MNELIKAAKAVIEKWDLIKPDQVPAYIKELHAAVERAEKPPAYFMEWWETFPLKTDDVVPAVHAWEAGFTAAQQAEREKIKDIIKGHASGGWVRCCNQILEMIDDE